MTSWLEISRSNLEHNVRYFRRLLNPQTKLFAVVKGNAYGHGQAEIVSSLKRNKLVDGFVVFELSEALAIRKQTTKPILILGFWPRSKSELRAAARAKITLPIKDLADAQYLNSLGVKVSTQIKVDVGTRRLGIDYRQAVGGIEQIVKLKNLQIQGIFSHFADSENRQQDFTHLQFQRFLRVIHELHKDNIIFPLNHIACTAAVLRQPSYQVQGLRLGLGLYGLEPYHDQKRGGVLKPVLSWKTKVLQVKAVKRGDTVGYGQSYRVTKDSFIATIPVGYYDGFDRRFSNNATVLIKGQRYPVVGRICMNVMMIALPAKHQIKVDDIVTLIGRDGKELITVDDLAKWSATINYEVTTRLNPLLPRIICS